MPLDRNDKALLGRLEPFEHVVVRRINCGFEDGGETFDGLMVQRIHTDPLPRPFGNSGARYRPNVVHELGFGFASRVAFGRKTELRRQILIERAAESDVEDLRAAANGENRKVLFPGLANEVEFELVALRLNGAALGKGRLAVEPRVDVGTAREQQPVELIEELVEHDLFGKRQSERHAARSADALFVPGARSDDTRLAKTGGREADQRFSSKHEVSPVCCRPA